VTTESDAKEVVNLCNEDTQNRSELMAICQEIVEIRRPLPSLSISLVGRDANNTAHFCAKQASSDRRRCRGLIITHVFSLILFGVIVILASN
jgi:hypothetical protein